MAALQDYRFKWHRGVGNTGAWLDTALGVRDQLEVSAKASIWGGVHYPGDKFRARSEK